MRVAVVGFRPPRQRHHRAVMKVVVPERVETVAALLGWPHEPRVLRLILRNEKDRPVAGRFARATADRFDDMRARGVVDLLRGVEPQAIQMKFVDPVAGVRDEELTHGGRVGAVEIDRVAPLVRVFVGEVRRRKRAQVVPDGAQMVVHHVEHDGDTGGVRHVDEAPEVVGTSVQSGRRKEIDAVVSPAEFSVKVCNRHHLDHRDAEPGQFLELARRGRPRALTRERAHVHFVGDLAANRGAAPCGVGPLEGGRVDYFGRTVRSIRLKS